VGLNTLFDPIFQVPFLVGLLLSLAVPPLGCYIRLRDEWLSSLALAQLAAAGALVGAIVGLPPMAGAFGVAVLAGLLKGWFAWAGNDLYALGISAGWAAANIAHGDEISHGLTDGQLYFAGTQHLVSAGALVLAIALVLGTQSRQLLVARLMPERYTSNRKPLWPLDMLFNGLVAAAIAITTTAVGVIGTFTLVFVPASLVFHVSSGWKRAIALSVALGLGAYLPAFAGAILLDQPFGPVFVVALLAGAALLTAVGLPRALQQTK
jgi:zinc transport system permease protein